MSPIRVLLADDHTLVRAGIRSLLESVEGLEVVADLPDPAGDIVGKGWYLWRKS